ncbi:MAG: hypothetical protein ACK5KU_04330 [Beutenbergiaceae bacterium]
MDALVVVVVAFVVALLMLVVLVLRHRPEAGFASWLKESFGSWNGRSELAQMRSDSARLVDPIDNANELHVDDILAMAEPGQAYHRPLDVAARRKAVGR